MGNSLSLAELTGNISRKLLDSINLLNILDELNDGDVRYGTIISILQNNITKAFRDIESCRNKIN